MEKLSNSVPVYVLRHGHINDEGHIVSKNVGVTFCIHDAETHQSGGFENSFDTLQFSGDPQDQMNKNELILVVRELVADVEESLK